jgi:TPR repeat protein
MIKRLLAICCLLSANAFSFSFPNDDKAAAAMQSGHYAEAYCNWKPLAKRGDADAQYNLGWLYANGLGMHVDPSMAAYWWRLAASQDNHDAQFALAFAIVSGDIDSESIKEAQTYLLKPQMPVMKTRVKCLPKST